MYYNWAIIPAKKDNIMSQISLANQPVSTDLMSIPDMSNAIELLLYSLSPTSKRVYAHTFAAWRAFTQEHSIPSYDMSAANLIAFLESDELSHTTKQARLSHLRRLLQALHASYPQMTAIQVMYEQAKLLKVKRSAESTKNPERNKTALARQQVYQAFEVWSEDTKLHCRNRALLAVLFYAGLRRSESAALLWDDIDLEEGIVKVRHGKGDKERTVPFLGDETPIRFLREWQKNCAGRSFVFCSIRKGDHLDADKAMSDQAVYNVMKSTSEAIGVDFAPHDARRTLLTRALASGSSVKDMQFIAGHANAETTLRYAVVKDAHEVKGRAKLDY
jgi:integrase/recombinase XerD